MGDVCLDARVMSGLKWSMRHLQKARESSTGASVPEIRRRALTSTNVCYDEGSSDALENKVDGQREIRLMC